MRARPATEVLLPWVLRCRQQDKLEQANHLQLASSTRSKRKRGGAIDGWGFCAHAHLIDLHPCVLCISDVDAVAFIDPQASRSTELANSTARLSKRAHQRAIRFVHADDGVGSITDVDVPVFVESQPIFSSAARAETNNNAITSNAVAVEIKELNPRSVRIQNRNFV